MQDMQLPPPERTLDVHTPLIGMFAQDVVDGHQASNYVPTDSNIKTEEASSSANGHPIIYHLYSLPPFNYLKRLSRRTRWIISAIVLLVIMLLAGVISVLVSLHSVSAKSPYAIGVEAPIVTLSYGKYQGVALSNNITHWLGIRYAAPPIGNLRFAAPADPLPFEGIQLANKVQAGCMGVGPQFDSEIVSEDCLFLDLYAPSSATRYSNLPVFVWIQGGGLNGDDSHSNGSNLITAAEMNMIVITFTYRGSAFGFLAGQEIKADGAAFNNGLRDQRKVLQWVQENIAAFGGNPNHVVLGGQSAGAGSALDQMLAFSGRNDGLFHGVIAESPSMPAIRTIEESQYQYDALVTRARCNGTVDTLACLRAMDVTSFEKINLDEPFPEAGVNGKPIYSYNPCLDGDFIREYPIQQLEEKKFVDVPTLFGSNTNEGTIFADQDDVTMVESQNYLNRQFPMLTNTMLEMYAELYNFTNSTLEPFWYHESAAYGETRYVCSSMYSSTAFYDATKSDNWVYHFDQNDPSFGDLLVMHGAELGAVWGSGGPPSFSAENAYIVPLVQNYWVSFIQTLNPNTKKLSSAPVWDAWDPEKLNRMHLVAHGPGMEALDLGIKARCTWVQSIALEIRQ